MVPTLYIKLENGRRASGLGNHPKSISSGGFTSTVCVNFGLVLERGPGGLLWEKRRSNDAGRRHWRPAFETARAMACGSNPGRCPN